MTPALSSATRVRLPCAIDIRSVATLTDQLLALRGQPVSLDASGVERLGGLGLQMLLSARLTWQADNLPFAIIDPSDAFLADAALLGAPVLEAFPGTIAP